LIIVRYIEVYNHKFLCFVRVFHPPPPSYFALFRSAILEGGVPLGNFKMENPPPSFLEGAPFKNHIYITTGFDSWSLVSRCTSAPIPK
jgi:hypothetical protein